MSSVAERSDRPWAQSKTGCTLERTLGLAPMLVGVALLVLALADGGQDLDTLAWVQTISFLILAVTVVAGAIPRIPTSWSIVGMIATIAVSSFVSVRPESSVNELLLWLMYLSLFLITAATLSGPLAVRRFVDAAVTIGGVLCLIGLFLFWGANNPAMRWYSTFYWPNPFAGFLLLLLPVALVRFFHTRGARETFAHGAVALLLAASLVLTYSRGALVSLILTIPLALLVLRPPSWGALVRRVALLAVLVTVAVVLLTRGAVLQGSPRGVIGGSGPASTFDDLSIRGRLAFWQSGIRMFWAHPLIGSGAGTFGAVHPLYQQDVRFYAQDAHNRYLQTAAELGLAGLAVLTTLVISVGILWRRTLQVTRLANEYPLIAGIGLGLWAFAVHSAVDMDWSFPANPAMAFALIGVLAGCDRATQDQSRPWSTGRVGGVWSRYLAVAGLLLAVSIVQVLQVAHRQFAEGQGLAQAGQWADAAGRYATAAQWNPLSPRYWGALAVASTSRVPPAVEVAATAIHRAMAVDRMNAAHPLQLARLIMAQGGDPASNAEAEALLHQALRLDPFNRPDAHRTLALLYLREGRPDDARMVYDDAMARYRSRDLGRGSILYSQLWPDVTSLFMDAAEFSVRRGDVSRAVEVLRELLAEDPTAVPAAIRLAAIYVQLGKPDDARGVLESTAARLPQNVEVRGALDALR